jgi:phosphoribosylformylglycinamidine (FGAM) synthase-like amidotransferase family enzyme
LVSINGITGVEISSDSGVDRIYFNPDGSVFEIGGIVSDGEKVVIREKSNEVVSYALVNGTKLLRNGTD